MSIDHKYLEKATKGWTAEDYDFMDKYAIAAASLVIKPEQCFNLAMQAVDVRKRYQQFKKDKV